jgi:hypothetical protein
MAWPPAIVCRRVALVVYGVSLLLYLLLAGMLYALGLDTRAVLVVAQFVALFGLALWLARLLRLPVTEAFALRPAAGIHFAAAAAAALPLQVGGGALQFAILGLLPDDSPLRRMMEETIGRLVAVEGPGDLAMLFLAVVVTAALCEEFLFRGLILQLLVRRAGWGSAIVWSAALFAIYHLNPVVLLPVGLVGAWLALLVWRSGSLYPAIAAHGLNNAVALFALPLLVDEAVYGRYLAVTLAGAIAAFALVLYVYLALTPAQATHAAEPLVSTRAAPPVAPPAGRPGGLEGDRVDGRLGDGKQAEHSQ